MYLHTHHAVSNLHSGSKHMQWQNQKQKDTSGTATIRYKYFNIK